MSEGKELTLESLLCASTSNTSYLTLNTHSVPHTYLIIGLIWLIGSEKLRYSPKVTQQVNVVPTESGALWLQSPPFSTENSAPWPVCFKAVWACPHSSGGQKTPSVFALQSTAFKVPFTGEKVSLILPLFTYKGFVLLHCFCTSNSYCFIIKSCSRPHWVLNTDFCSNSSSGFPASGRHYFACKMPKSLSSPVPIV